MAYFGKSIRIYLKDGNVTGIKFGEVVNQTIQSISCPRLRVGELSTLLEAKRPGVYFLMGLDEETGEAKAYIGEAENVFDRLQSHILNKDFWNEVIIFVSKDENLTKSHVKYLESRLIQTALSIKRYKIDNNNQSQASALPPADRDAMEEFLTYIKLLVGVFGHKLLEEVTNKNFEQPISAKKPDALPIVNHTEILETQNEYFVNVSDIKAKAIQTDEGIVVLKSSELAMNIMNSLSFGYREFREKLINNGSLKLSGDKYIFEKDVLFDSPSQAAGIIVGYSINGPSNWKNSQGKSLKEVEKEKFEKTIHSN